MKAQYMSINIIIIKYRQGDIQTGRHKDGRTYVLQTDRHTYRQYCLHTPCRITAYTPKY